MNSIRQETGRVHSGVISYALLRLDQTRLLIPQSDVRVLELTMDMSRENPPSGGVGWIRFREQQHPVYSPSARLEWLSEVPEGHALCALMEAEHGLFGLLCNEVTLVKLNELQFRALPAAMATPDSPFVQLAMYEGKLACLSSAKSLFTHLPMGSEK